MIGFKIKLCIMLIILYVAYWDACLCFTIGTWAVVIEYMMYSQIIYLLTYIRSWALPKKLPTVQPFRKFPAILRNLKVHHHVHKSPLPVPILSQFNPVPTIPSYISKIHFNIVHPPTSWSSQWSLSFWLSHQYPICMSNYIVRLIILL
jgi:hypothetical protein